MTDIEKVESASIGISAMLASGLNKSVLQRVQDADKDGGARRFIWQTAPDLCRLRPNHTSH
jgi:hypothetical protein